MTVREIKKDIFCLGMDDHELDLFEGMWDVSKDGVSINAYLILDEKTALIDISSELLEPPFSDELAKLMGNRDLDYLIVNHMEMDHTGAIHGLLAHYPNVKILCSMRAKKMLAEHYNVVENVKGVLQDDELSLGKHTLRFYMTPNVHWPETMMTYETTQQILFSCDAFGAFGCLNGILFDDEVKPEEMPYRDAESLRYYANIVASFSKPVKQALSKLEGVNISMVAPSHGLVWRQNPEYIIEQYARFANYATEPGEKAVTILLGSMYGMTRSLMPEVLAGLEAEGIRAEVFDTARQHPSYILASLWKNEGVIVASSTYEGRLFPYINTVLELAAHKRMRGKRVAFIGSTSWGGGARKDLLKKGEEMGWEISDLSYEFDGQPKPEDVVNAKEFGKAVGAYLKE